MTVCVSAGACSCVHVAAVRLLTATAVAQKVKAQRRVQLTDATPAASPIAHRACVRYPG